GSAVQHVGQNWVGEGRTIGSYRASRANSIKFFYELNRRPLLHTWMIGLLCSAIAIAIVHRSTLKAQGSTRNAQRSTFNVQRSRTIRDAVDLDAQPLARQRGCLNRRARGTMLAEHAFVDAIHLPELLHVEEKHAAAQHV